MINKKLLEKYNVMPLEDLTNITRDKKVAELSLYQDFLVNTDYLAMKLAEGLITREDKKAEFDARDFARAEINRLQTETK